MTKRLAACLLAVLLCMGTATAEETLPAPGTLVTFGACEQNGDPSDGPEPIAWLVLDTRGGDCLLLSCRALDARPFHAHTANVTWEQSSLRAWLNADFLQAAFTAEEAERIRPTELDNGIGQSDLYCADGGPATVDRVFLLSFAECGAYLTGDAERACAPTAYALQRGARVNGKDLDAAGDPACWWWLRSPGFYRYYAASVLASGARTNLSGVDAPAGGVRPALWVEAAALLPME
ncbi:MAG: hypothetical protein IKP10_00420 [Clostridia bacterium]|nr:hypothetical protein [Clostridia bacterium]